MGVKLKVENAGNNSLLDIIELEVPSRKLRRAKSKDEVLFFELCRESVGG